MSKITYVEEHKIKVYLDSKHVGTIKKELSTDGLTPGFRYYPKGNKFGGDLYFGLPALKRSLET